MVLAALSLGIQHLECRARTGQLSVRIMWLNGISCQSVWGLIFQWGSILKVSIELPATSIHRCDMTERLLKVMLSPNQTNKQTKLLAYLVAHSDVHPTGGQEVTGLISVLSGNILSWRLIMKYFLWSFSPFCQFKKGSCQFLVKESARSLLTKACPVKVWLGKLTALNTTPLGCLVVKPQHKRNKDPDRMPHSVSELDLNLFAQAWLSKFLGKMRYSFILCAIVMLHIC